MDLAETHHSVEDGYRADRNWRPMSPPTLSPATGATSVTVHGLLRVGDNHGIEILTEPVGGIETLDVMVEAPINFAAALPAMRNARAVDEADWVLGSGPLGI